MKLPNKVSIHIYIYNIYEITEQDIYTYIHDIIYMKLPNKISIHIYIYNIYEITEQVSIHICEYNIMKLYTRYLTYMTSIVEAYHVKTIIIYTYIIYMMKYYRTM